MTVQLLGDTDAILLAPFLTLTQFYIPPRLDFSEHQNLKENRETLQEDVINQIVLEQNS